MQGRKPPLLDESRLGQRIKQARKAAHMTAEAFAEATDISVSFLREIERGSKKPSIAKFVEIANVLGVSADELLCDSVNSARKIVLSGIAQELDGLPPNQIQFIENMIKTMKVVI